ncbi:nitrogenase molybdenum-iron protein alpha/beta subunit [Natranaerovirga hydrolytica]|uniref:Nitrogenase molybdenum-iron protein alpha/beta subunit n=1 Tax=Natranaerovirga hydrolytica TaxID=680378 RepID=A0A4R1MPS9_9FIRM|nr:nitrogenase component 1 [Natranaerovirga hydrolytica]TCK93334.1 nitrogenase molybdenum-iron protein alpha/beta subunit [Natranaerovirga hydrolytica]
MGLFKHYPVPSDRMGALWTLLSIKGSCILEFGTSGTTRFTLNGFARMNGKENSKIFSTHLYETDIALGKIDALEKALVNIIEKHNPSVVFIMPSTISSVIGTDIEAYCKIYQQKYAGTQIIYIRNDGFQGNWTVGIEDTLTVLVDKLAIDGEKSGYPTFNIIGSCVDHYNYLSDAYEITRMMKEGFNAQPMAVLTSDTHIEDIKKMGRAHINLVLRREGIKSAKILEERFGMPYIVGKPYGLEGTLKWLSEISQVLNGMNEVFINQEKKVLLEALKVAKAYAERQSVIMNGHIDVVKGMHWFIKDEIGCNVTYIWHNAPNIKDEDIPYYEESQWESILLEKNYNVVMSNALVLDLAKDNCKKIQIDIPNYKFDPIQYPYTPYVGLRGALNLLKLLINP